MENYIGPYWSDGKWQESVEFGDKPALSGVDAASRLHDSAYAHYTDEAHRIAADEIYSDTLRKLNEPLAGLADVPLYGNYVKNRVSEYGSDFLTGFKYAGLLGGLGSLVYNGIKGIIRSNDLIQNGKRYRDEVLDYYDTDPFKIVERPVENKRNILVSVPKPIAPLQTDTKEDMFKKKSKVSPSQPPPAEVATPRRVQVAPALTPLYRPLKRKKPRALTAGDWLKYLEYHPNEVERVRAWLLKQSPQ